MNTVNTKIKSIQCTQCAAPLDLNGGRQVKSISCPYCGSVLDTKDEYKVVEHFLKADRPYTPLPIGQEGIINGVSLTIIGLIEYKTADNRGWIEYQLFSPTHGYSWLSYEGGHFVFGHKVRYYPKSYTKDWQSDLEVNGKKYTVIDSYRAGISYVQGELTWIARKNDQVEVIESIAPPYIYSIEQTMNEEEYSLGEYLKAETVLRAFGIQRKPAKTYWIHPAQPYEQGDFWRAVTKNSQFFGKIYLLICLSLLLFVYPESLLSTSVTVDQYQKGFISNPFVVENPDRALKLTLNIPLRNSWAFFSMEIKKGNGELVYSAGKEMYYFFNSLEQKGSQQASLYFKVPSAGDYTLSVSGYGGQHLHALFIDIQQGVFGTNYFWYLLWVSIFFGWVWPFWGEWQFNKKRWRDCE